MTEEVEVLEQPEGKTFDFTGPVHMLEGLQKRIYYGLRRAAILAGDGSGLPDGKIYTESQVIEILGDDYANAPIGPGGCC